MTVRDLKPGLPFAVEGGGSLSGSKTVFVKLDDQGCSSRDNALIMKLFLTTRLHGDLEVTWFSPVPIEHD